MPLNAASTELLSHTSGPNILSLTFLIASPKASSLRPQAQKSAPKAPATVERASSQSQPPLWTIARVLQWTAEYFQRQGILSPRVDAEQLLAHALGCSRLDLYLEHERPLEVAERTRFREWVRRRSAREPLAYILGHASFWTLELAVGPGVLIPRPETELLVEALESALQAWRTHTPGNLCVLEFGTGSAAIPLAACAQMQGLHWIGVDCSALAITWAKRNRAKHAALLAPRENALSLVCARDLKTISRAAPPAMLIANPPYIPSETVPTLMAEVSQAEPRSALDGGTDGLRYQRLLVQEAAERLPPQGWLLLEIGAEQLPALQDLIAAQENLVWQAPSYDHNRRPRIVRALRRS